VLKKDKRCKGKFTDDFFKEYNSKERKCCLECLTKDHMSFDDVHDADIKHKLEGFVIRTRICAKCRKKPGIEIIKDRGAIK
jgi:hypothetical protein